MKKKLLQFLFLLAVILMNIIMGDVLFAQVPANYKETPYEDSVYKKGAFAPSFSIL